MRILTKSIIGTRGNKLFSQAGSSVWLDTVIVDIKKCTEIVVWKFWVHFD